MKSLHERFWEKVDLFFGITDEDCWNWTVSLYPQGYGCISVDGRLDRAHRVSWMLKNSVAEIPNGLCCLHKCDNRRCVNPSHLFLGTKSDNLKDMSEKGRGRNQNSYITHCIKGHEFTPDNTYTYPNGKRACMECARIYKRRGY